MTLTYFRLLTPPAQITFSLVCGTYLAPRWEGEDRVLLYHLPDGGRGFFAEVGYDTYSGRAVVLRSFSDSKALADYTQWVRLPGE